MRVRGIEHGLDRILAGLLALGHIALGEGQVVDDVVGLGPELELIVFLKKWFCP